MADLLTLTAEARQSLLPPLAARGGPLHAGPTFAGSADIPAEADVIAGGLLTEIKVTLGHPQPDGARRCTLERETLDQLLGYLLLDYDNAYQIDTLGLYSARHGHLATWSVADLLEELAHRPVDLAVARAEFRAVAQTVAQPMHPTRPNRDEDRRPRRRAHTPR